MNNVRIIARWIGQVHRRETTNISNLKFLSDEHWG